MAARSLTEMPVSDVMRHGVLSCQAETPLRTVARMMAQHRVHAVIVTHLDGVSETAWGVVSDVDVLRSTEAEIDRRTAGDSAATELLEISPNESLEHAARLMSEHELTHLVAVKDGRPVGVLSSLDVAAALAA